MSSGDTTNIDITNIELTEPTEPTECTDDVFDSFISAITAVGPDYVDYTHGFCPDCKIPMTVDSTSYICDQCGLITDTVEIDTSSFDASVGKSRGGKGKQYHKPTEYAKTQIATIMAQLTQCANNYKGPPIPRDILHRVALEYNKLQQIRFDNPDGSKTKFVRRGDIKNEILTALLASECAKSGVARKEQEYAQFIGLSSNGFSRGSGILRELSADNFITLPEEVYTVDSIMNPYLERLGLDTDENRAFIRRIIEASYEHVVAMDSHLNSKVVACIRLIIVKNKLDIKDSTLEQATGNTKKNTYMKFYNAVRLLPDIFGHI